MQIASVAKRVLFIGNSLTFWNQGVDVMLAKLVPGVETKRGAVGGATLETLWGNDEARLACADNIDVVVLQEDLPLVPEPFDTWAAESGWDVDDLLAKADELRERTLMRRFAAVLNHRRAGFGANGMAVWKVPADQVDDFGSRMATFTSVSHCYRRPTYDDWPYSLFTMVHARSKDACEETIAALADEAGLGADDYAVLYSTFEFKKVRLRYYSPQYRAWEDIAMAGQPLPTG